MRLRPSAPRVETLEGRALLSGPGTSIHPTAHIALSPKSIVTDPAGVAAILSALKGGPGSEFTSLLKGQIRSLPKIVNQFISGTRTEYSIPGIAFKIPQFQEAYTGPHYDQLGATAAGGLKLKNGTYEFGAILLGSIHLPQPSTYVFGIDRGKGAATSTPFGSRPNIKIDALVSVTFTAGTATGTVTDLTNNHTTALDPSQITTTGSTLRVYVAPSLLPSKGLPTSAYRFSFWTKSDVNGGIESVGSFVPESTMARIVGVKVNRSA